MEGAPTHFRQHLIQGEWQRRAAMGSVRLQSWKHQSSAYFFTHRVCSRTFNRQHNWNSELQNDASRLHVNKTAIWADCNFGGANVFSCIFISKCCRFVWIGRMRQKEAKQEMMTAPKKKNVKSAHKWAPGGLNNIRSPGVFSAPLNGNVSEQKGG